MGKKFAGGATPKFFKSFCQLSRNAKLPIRHDIGTNGKCLPYPIRRFEKEYCFGTIGGRSQFSLALSTFDGKKSPE
jgi:hypothetical protein